jgi:hypothetical protein
MGYTPNPLADYVPYQNNHLAIEGEAYLQTRPKIILLVLSGYNLAQYIHIYISYWDPIIFPSSFPHIFISG